MSENGKIDPNGKVPAWVLWMVAAGGLGGLGLGGAQLVRTPADLGDKIDAVAQSVAKLEGKVDVLTAESKAEGRAEERERARLEERLSKVETRVDALEQRRAR